MIVQKLYKASRLEIRQKQTYYNLKKLGFTKLNRLRHKWKKIELLNQNIKKWVLVPCSTY